MRRTVAFLVVTACLTVQVARAQLSEEPAEHAPIASNSSSESNGNYWGAAGYGTLAVLANVLYMPAKLVYAIVGVPIGGLAYLLTAGDDVTAQKIWSPSLGGTYVLSPAMLRNEEPVLFSGASYSND